MAQKQHKGYFFKKITYVLFSGHFDQKWPFWSFWPENNTCVIFLKKIAHMLFSGQNDQNGHFWSFWSENNTCAVFLKKMVHVMFSGHFGQNGHFWSFWSENNTCNVFLKKTAHVLFSGQNGQNGHFWPVRKSVILADFLGNGQNLAILVGVGPGQLLVILIRSGQNDQKLALLRGRSSGQGLVWSKMVNFVIFGGLAKNGHFWSFWAGRVALRGNLTNLVKMAYFGQGQARAKFGQMAHFWPDLG